MRGFIRLYTVKSSCLYITVVLITAFLRSVPSPCSAISPYTKRGAITVDARRIGLCCSAPLLSLRQWNRSVSVLHTAMTLFWQLLDKQQTPSGSPP